MEVPQEVSGPFSGSKQGQLQDQAISLLCYWLKLNEGQGSEQPDLVEDVPAHCRGVGLDDF